ncbi:MAG: manganese efflux pump MntP family protein, partial [Candidatus Enteromonas sp.]
FLMGLDTITMVLTSVSMSVDAMTVNATNGLEEKGIKQGKMIFLSFLFGLFQFGMPVLGYFVGQTFEQYVSAYIPWIGFGLLMLLGIKSLIDWIKEAVERKKSGSEEPRKRKIGVGRMFVEAIATSIDALCIGFAYMWLPVEEAMLFFGIIGITTFALSYLAIVLAKWLAKWLQNWAGLLAALVFMGIAIKILVEGILP